MAKPYNPGFNIAGMVAAKSTENNYIPTSKENIAITYLNIEKLDPDPDNSKIYSEEQIDELADSIARQGLIQPIVVFTKPDGRFQVIVGHRRRLALLKLLKNDDKYKLVACIIKTPSGSVNSIFTGCDLPQERIALLDRRLTGLDSNALTRKFSDSDKLNMYKEYSEIFDEITANGGSISSKRREYITNSLRISEHTYSKLKNVSELNTEPGQFLRDNIEEVGITNAAEIIKLPEARQQAIISALVEALKGEGITAKLVTDLIAEQKKKESRAGDTKKSREAAKDREVIIDIPKDILTAETENLAYLKADMAKKKKLDKKSLADIEIQIKAIEKATKKISDILYKTK